MSQKSIALHPNSPYEVSIAETDEIIHQLQTAFIDGRLDEKECEDRITRAVQAKTKEELWVLNEDLALPTPSGLRSISPRAFAVFSGLEQKGQYMLPKNYHITAIMGGCLVDLREAKFENNVTDIKVTAIMGGVQILVPKGVRVAVSGLPIFAGIAHDVSTQGLSPHAPLLNIRGLAIMGGIEIKTA